MVNDDATSEVFCWTSINKWLWHLNHPDVFSNNNNSAANRLTVMLTLVVAIVASVDNFLSNLHAD